MRVVKISLKIAFNNALSVLKHRNYLILSVVSFMASLAVLLWLSRLDTLFVMNSFPFIFASLTATFFTAGLFAVNTPLVVHRFKLLRQISGKPAAGSVLGLFGGLAGSGCPVCGSAILSLLGISGGLAVFPFKGLELKSLGVVLLGISAYSLSRSLSFGKTCSSGKTCVSKKSQVPKKFQDSLEGRFGNYLLVGLVLSGLLVGFNQVQISSVSSAINSLSGVSSPGTLFIGGSADLSGVDVTPITSTAMAVATLFPELNSVQNEQDAINVMIPTGTPEYSEALGGISFDDPVNSMEYLAKWYYSLKQEIQQNDPQTWQRYLNLAAAPKGVSCEFCCGVGPQGVTADGTLRCGCKHNPASQAVALGLMKYTEYSDAQVLREVMRWKTIFFPRNMVGLAMQVAGTDPSTLKELPGMVGGC